MRLMLGCEIEFRAAVQAACNGLLRPAAFANPHSVALGVNKRLGFRHDSQFTENQSYKVFCARRFVAPDLNADIPSCPACLIANALAAAKAILAVPTWIVDWLPAHLTFTALAHL